MVVENTSGIKQYNCYMYNVNAILIRGDNNKLRMAADLLLSVKKHAVRSKKEGILNTMASKESNKETKQAISLLIEAMTCDPVIYTWQYDEQGHLKETNCPHNVYDRMFVHTGCLQYMLDHGKEEHTPLLLAAKFGIMWCAVSDADTTTGSVYYVLGPVFNDEVNEDLIQDAIMHYRIDPAWLGEFRSIVFSTPVISQMLFIQYAILLNYHVTGNKIRRSDIRYQHVQRTDAAGSKSTNRRSRHHTYQIEQRLLQKIREGDPDFSEILSKAGQISTGIRIMTGDPVQRAILSASNFTALCVRAAIEGGLTPDTAYTVGDSYIQSLTECRSIADVRTVNHAMMEDLVRRVSNEHQRPQYSQQIKTCVSYIEAHADEDLDLETLARISGYSIYHLSHKFKAETGINIREYIRNTRIERAKTLLSSSDMSIHEISEQLHFCSSGHFAHIFRVVTGGSPAQYRKENYK